MNKMFSSSDGIRKTCSFSEFQNINIIKFICENLLLYILKHIQYCRMQFSQEYIIVYQFCPLQFASPQHFLFQFDAIFANPLIFTKFRRQPMSFYLTSIFDVLHTKGRNVKQPFRPVYIGVYGLSILTPAKQSNKPRAQRGLIWLF